MTELKKVGDLQIDEDITFQHREWAVERWGWTLMLILTVAALLGLFGQGPLSHASAESGPLHVQYGRFERLLAPAQMIIQLDAQAVRNGEARLQIDHALLDYYTIQSVEPDADSQELSAEHVTYIFKIPAPGERVTVIMSLISNKMGPLQGNIGLENGPTLQIRQFIYP